MAASSDVKTCWLDFGGSVDDGPVAFYDELYQGGRCPLLVRRALEVRVTYTSCGTGSAGKVQATAARDHLFVVLPKRACSETREAVPHGLAHELDSITGQKHMGRVTRLDGRCSDEESESRLGWVLRTTGDVNKKARHEGLPECRLSAWQ